MEFQYLKNCKNIIIKDLILLKPKIFPDNRGYFIESWNKKKFANLLNKDFDFLQDNFSYSIHGVLRGLHYQTEPFAQDKLVSCEEGEIFDVAVDLRRNSETFGDWVGITLDDIEHKQFWIPKGFAHGFLVISKSAKVKYKTTNYYSSDSERSIIWDDQDLNINWPLEKIKNRMPILSEKDADSKTFQKFEIDF